jgi:phosphoglycolate phosphatase-like HAD superfamily hydrolase
MNITISKHRGSSMKKDSLLVLFDIDGTLVHCGSTPRRAFGRAMEETFGTAGPIDNWIFDGKTDPLIVRELMDTAGVKWNEESVNEALDRYVNGLARELPDEPAKEVCPGVRELLDELQRREALLGLLTGNVRAGAKAKLESFDLWRYFPFGGFADDSHNRNEIAEEAVRRAEEYTGRAWSGKDIVIIGDTPHDVGCGRHLGARAIGVGTGRSTAAELLAAGAEAAFDDLSDTATVIQTIIH